MANPLSLALLEHCLVSFSLKQPKTLPKYQFVPAIPIVEQHSTPLTQWHLDRLKRVHPSAGRSVDLTFVASSSLKALHHIRCHGVEQALEGEQDHCEGGQMSVEQIASETAAYMGCSHSRPTTGWAFLFHGSKTPEADWLWWEGVGHGL